MTSNLNLFEHLSLKEEGIVRTSSGAEELKIKGNGTIKLNNDSGKIVLHNVLYVPDLAVNLISVRSPVINGYSVKFEMNHFSITNTSGLTMSGKYVNNLPTLMFANVEHSSNLSSSEALHKSLGHVSYHRLRRRLGVAVNNCKPCKACALTKITKASFHSRHSRASKSFEEIHLDLVGPISPSSREGHKYFLTIVDSFSRFCSAIPVRNKGEVTEVIAQAVGLEAKRIGYYPTVIHSDRGTEFINKNLMDFCNKNLISARQSDAYTPQQNGLAERFNRTLLESMRATLQDTGLNKRLWNEIIKTSALVLNQIPSHKSKSSPYKLFKGRSLPLSFFKPIGMKLTYYILPERSKSKTLTKGEMGSLIGFNDELRSYKVYGENGRIIDTKHVQFLLWSRLRV